MMQAKNNRCVYWLSKTVLIFLLLPATKTIAQAGGTITSLDWLYETGPKQRRDLSMPGSRAVINFFDFNSSLTPAEYSNGAELPLNVAYLGTLPNTSAKGKEARMSRAVKGLLSIYKQDNKNGIDSASYYNTEWRPYALPFSATFADSSKIEGEDFFFNEEVIMRHLTLNNFNGDLIIRGIVKGKAYKEDDNITIVNEHMRYTVSVNRKTSVSIHDDFWEMRVPVSPDRDSLNIAVSFDPASKEKEFNESLSVKNVNSILNKRKDFWISLLNKIPQPKDFNLRSVATYGVQPEDLKRAYYKAWIFTAQNLLPPDMEYYPFPQICTGKPSLWDEGEYRAPFSAAWESFLGIQLYAYIDLQTAWNAFKGLMSLVDSTGMLGGESLPSRKAQTALLLYRLSGDTTALKEVYPALKRYFNWRLRIVHWVYGDLKPDENLKDAEFAFSALADLNDMMTISAVLGKYDELEEWKSKHKKFYNDCLKWFWPAPGVKPLQTIDLKTGKRTAGHAVWITTGLNLQPLLKGDHLKSMMELFDQSFDPAKPFAGFSMPKYPDLSFTVYGLMRHGYKQKAMQLMEANLRDVVRANASFAEQYKPGNLEPDGVRPSLFGSSAIIDFTLLMNGRSYLQPDSTDTKRPPVSNDLSEYNDEQRRDLSIPGSRLVINPYDFNKDATAMSPNEYSNSSLMPLHLAYLSRKNGYPKEGRFGRAFFNSLVLLGTKSNETVAPDHYGTSWSPHSLNFSVDYGSGNKFNGRDFFYNENIIIREIEADDEALIRIGGIIKGKLAPGTGNRYIAIESPEANYVICFGSPVSNLRYYKNEDDCRNGANALLSSKDAEWWSADTRVKKKLIIAVGFDLKDVSTKEITKRTLPATATGTAGDAYRKRIHFWDDYLSRLPHPSSFAFRKIDPKGVGPLEVRSAYYKAWICLAQNILPPQPGVFNYDQVATGKASLWDEGESHSPFSASWESFVGTQLYALMDPAVAWSALKGLLSLVDKDGMLGGESLPSRKAQTAWKLFQITNDTASLKTVYKPIRKYLSWRVKNPRWIYKNETPPDEKDAEFVVSALVDINSLIRIANVLDYPAEVTYWKDQKKQLFDEYLTWFWPNPDSMPVQHINNKPGRQGYPIQVTSGLILDELKGARLQSLLKLFKKHYDPLHSFGGFDAPKFPDVDFTAFGLFNKGEEEIATTLMECNIRDVIRSGMVFSESYTNADPPVPTGVRPSIFGEAQVITFVMFLNKKLGPVFY